MFNNKKVPQEEMMGSPDFNPDPLVNRGRFIIQLADRIEVCKEQETLYYLRDLMDIMIESIQLRDAPLPEGTIH